MTPLLGWTVPPQLSGVHLPDIIVTMSFLSPLPLSIIMDRYRWDIPVEITALPHRWTSFGQT